MITPLTCHALSTKPVSLATTVELKVAEPPTCLTSVLSTAFVMFQVYVRVKPGVVVLLTVRSTPTHTVTVLPAVWAVSTIVAVLSYWVQVAGEPLTVRE